MDTMYAGTSYRSNTAHVVKGNWRYGVKANTSLCGRVLDTNEIVAPRPADVCQSCYKSLAKTLTTQAEADLIASRAHHANTLTLMDVRPVATEVVLADWEVDLLASADLDAPIVDVTADQNIAMDDYMGAAEAVAKIIGDRRTMGDGIVDARCNEHVDYYATGVTIYEGTDFSCTYCGDAWKDGLTSSERYERDNNVRHCDHCLSYQPPFEGDRCGLCVAEAAPVGHLAKVQAKSGITLPVPPLCTAHGTAEWSVDGRACVVLPNGTHTYMGVGRIGNGDAHGLMVIFPFAYESRGDETGRIEFFVNGAELTMDMLTRAYNGETVTAAPASVVTNEGTPIINVFVDSPIHGENITILALRRDSAVRMMDYLYDQGFRISHDGWFTEDEEIAQRANTPINVDIAGHWSVYRGKGLYQSSNQDSYAGSWAYVTARWLSEGVEWMQGKTMRVTCTPSDGSPMLTHEWTV